MLRTRQATRDIEDQAIARTLAVDYSSGSVLRPHAHEWHQIIYASRGVMTVRTEHGAWVVPAKRAVWVPADTHHEITMSGAVAMRTVYLRKQLSDRIPDDCSVISVSPLLRELLLQAVRIGILSEETPAHVRLVGVILDQLAQHAAQPLQINMPRDRRALRVAEHVLAHPEDPKSLALLARRSGASDRTLERLFLSETSLTFSAWRQQTRLMLALQRLAGGDAVADVAEAVGYETASAFIAMFKRAMGTTPRKYYADSNTGVPEDP